VKKQVPTLIGVVIILLVVVLVLLVHNYKMSQGLASGGTVVGTVGQKALTGVEPPKEEIGVSEVLQSRADARQEPVRVPQTRERAEKHRERLRERDQNRAAGRAARRGSGREQPGRSQ
jgi:hypothetical protein